MSGGRLPISLLLIVAGSCRNVTT